MRLVKKLKNCIFFLTDHKFNRNSIAALMMCPQPLRDARPPQCSFIPGYTQFSTYPGYTFNPWCTQGWNSGFVRVHVYYSMAFYLMVDSRLLPWWRAFQVSLSLTSAASFGMYEKEFSPFERKQAVHWSKQKKWEPRLVTVLASTESASVLELNTRLLPRMHAPTGLNPFVNWKRHGI